MNPDDNLFKNVAEAKAYAKTLTDPVARAMCWSLYSTVLFKMAGVEPTGGFDLLYLFKLVNEFASDPEQLEAILALSTTPHEQEPLAHGDPLNSN